MQKTAQKIDTPPAPETAICALSASPADAPPWASVAEKITTTFPLDRLDYAAVRELWHADITASSVAVACSGGLDSVAAALLTWALFPNLRGRLWLFHFNHRTRTECAAEAEFVSKLASDLGAGFLCGERDPSAAENFRFVSEKPPTANGAAPATISSAQIGANSSDILLDANASENTLREARLCFFKTACERHDIRRLVQGHHADDVLENMLMRLGRGSGTEGLAAPRPVSFFKTSPNPNDLGGGQAFVRPLIALQKAEIRDALLRAGGHWLEDASNAEDGHLRNRIRHHVVPAWKHAQERDVAAGTARSRRLLEEDVVALEIWANSVWEKIARASAPEPNLALNWRPAAGLPVAIHRRLARKAIQRLAPKSQISASTIDSIALILAEEVSARWSLHENATLFFDGETLLLEPRIERDARFATASASLAPESSLFWNPPRRAAAETPITGWLHLQLVTLDDLEFAALRAGKFPPGRFAFLQIPPPSPKNRAGISPAAAPPPHAPFRVRTWQTGDSYQPLHAPGHRKLSDMFSDRKIPQALRHSLPIICDPNTNEILWVPGFPPAHKRRLLACGLCFRLTWKPSFSTFTPIKNPHQSTDSTT